MVRPIRFVGEEGADGGAAAVFFTSYELLKGSLPEMFGALKREEMAPLLHMLSASGGEVVSPSLDSCIFVWS